MCIRDRVSPMCAVSRMVKAQDPEAVTVFIGPCIAKKSETLDLNIEGNADYALTFGEIRALLRAKDINLEPEEDNAQEASVFGKRFGNGGGVTAAVLECLKAVSYTHLLMAKVLAPSGIIRESVMSSDSLLKLTITPVSSSPWAILSCGNSLTSSSVTLQPMA